MRRYAGPAREHDAPPACYRRGRCLRGLTSGALSGPYPGRRVYRLVVSAHKVSLARVTEDAAHDRDDDERRDRNERAAAAAAGAAFGTVIAGPAGAAIGAALGPILEPLVKGVWAELSESARQRQTDVLFWAIRFGIPVDELEERINASERTQLMTGFALNAATRTAWEDKLGTLGRSLATGLLADDNAKIDTEQMIIAAISDIEGPQLAMLELLVCWYPCQWDFDSLIAGPLDIPDQSSRGWDVGGREWPYPLIAYARPNLLPVAPSLLGTLQRHGLIVQNDFTDVEKDRYQNRRFFEQLEDAVGKRFTPDQRSGLYLYEGQPKVSWPEGKAPPLRWSPTELGEQVFLRFRDAGTDLPDVWASSPTDQQE